MNVTPKKQAEKSLDEIQEFKRFLGPIAKEYSDAQLRQLRREMYSMAALLLDIYLSKKRQKSEESPPEAFDNQKTSS